MTVNTNGPGKWEPDYRCEGEEFGVCSGRDPHAEDCPAFDQRWDFTAEVPHGGIAPESSYHNG